MKIDLHEITVREVVNGYVDSDEEGVVAYGGKLDIRPSTSASSSTTPRSATQFWTRCARNFPLNVMYWVVNDEGNYEVLDGQQRTVSFCQYVNGDFSIDIDGHPMAFHNLTQAAKDQLLDYKLMVYFCEGDDKEKLDWFKTLTSLVRS